MYVPHFNAVDDTDEICAMVEAVAGAHLVTVGPDGAPDSTLLPILWQDDTVVAHMARKNGHWERIAEGSPALLVVAGAQAYVSPSWYAAKAEHGKVVPTWNYSEVQLRGTAWVHHDHEWLREAVTRLTDRHEQVRAEPWAVTDAPGPYVEGQLRGIVGIEIRVETVEGKAKLSQNRSVADQEGVVAGLADETTEGAADVRAAMQKSMDAVAPRS